jgi:hypothetical protein
LPRKEGIVPDKLFILKSSFLSDRKLPRKEGIAPLSEALFIHKFLSEVKFAICAGQLLRGFSDMTKYCRFVSSARLEGRLARFMLETSK